MRPGGRVVVLEITTPQRAAAVVVLRLWFDRVVPVLGELAGDPDAYTYLPSSVRRFPGPRELGAELAAPASPTSAGSSRRAGSSPSTAGTVPAEP